MIDHDLPDTAEPAWLNVVERAVAAMMRDFERSQPAEFRRMAATLSAGGRLRLAVDLTADGPDAYRLRLIQPDAAETKNRTVLVRDLPPRVAGGLLLAGLGASR